MYYRINGECVGYQQGQELAIMVTIPYTVASNMEDGVVFDDTERNGVPLTFRFGDKDQVMQGLEVAPCICCAKDKQGVVPVPFGDGVRCERDTRCC